ncbi:putative phosphoribosyl pyrophosphate synthetase [Tupanvirus soda lake]|uniref:ribose-phosphate diphosphokinase n=2 Tax=Tupanvirus TaxID=2094720 RepID=A0A6N1NUE5_9VIRU|nr:putative phosphoribosyl pyrophosphate synthetase [Tupanvirus soda lake]QKU35937.1 putative phosphoribosyl pyrophosphate synthetase [Tupanvirus soda lake]
MNSSIEKEIIALYEENNELLNRITNLEKIVKNIKQNDSVVIVLDSCKELGDGVVDCLKEKLEKINTTYFRFGNNEINTFPSKSVRSKDVYIVGTGSNYNGTINDNLIAMFGMIRSCRDASAKHITAITAYYPYSRSDKKDQSRTPIMSKLVSDFFKTAGANRLITVDLHAAQIQGFFKGPFDNLYATKYLLKKILEDYPNDFVVISPDAGGIKRIQDWASQMDCTYTFLTKSRDHNSVSKIMKHDLVHQIDFTGKKALLVDDIGDTLGTLNSAAKILKEKGAVEVIAAVTHGIFSGNAFEYLNQSYIDRIYTTNTLPQETNVEKSHKIVVVDISELFANAILSCVNATSMSVVF